MQTVLRGGLEADGSFASSSRAQLREVQHRLAVLQAQAAAAQRASFASAPVGGAGFTGGGFTPHGGDWGFFPAAGTNYSVGVEPEIAARLDAMGKALHLHLIGLSGYRTPQHSVAVGGFADDPHTRGEAEDIGVKASCARAPPRSAKPTSRGSGSTVRSTPPATPTTPRSTTPADSERRPAPDRAGEQPMEPGSGLSVTRRG
jgi:hypothetical protein